MSSLASKLNNPAQPKDSGKPNKGENFQQTKQPFFLQAIIEGFVDGVLILTENGDWVHANEGANRICRYLSSSLSSSHIIPQQIWKACQPLIESRELFSEQNLILETEVLANNTSLFRIRVRWLELEERCYRYLLVTIEDRQRTTQTTAIAEAQKYGLTPREAEVWLLRRANYSYKEIAARLYITLNTVKKHMKNVYAKQQANASHQDDAPMSQLN